MQADTCAYVNAHAIDLSLFPKSPAIVAWIAGANNVIEVFGSLVANSKECWVPSKAESIDAIFSPRLSKSYIRKRRSSTSFQTTNTNSYNIATKSRILEHEAQSEHECC